MIEALSYIGFTSPHAAQWTSFGPDLLGLGLAEPSADGAVRLRVDDAPWRIAIHFGERDDVACLGWSVPGADDLDAVTDRLVNAGVEVHREHDVLAQAREAAAVASFVDPFGLRHELNYGRSTQPGSFVAGREGVSFVTGAGGLGHAVVIVPDFEVAARFFVDVLGFRISDDIDDGITVRFLHCNARHHSLAFTAIPGMRGFHHLMLEVSDHVQVEAAWQRVRDRGLPVAMTLGTHTNDEMYSFYVRTPSGFEIEYGSGGKIIDTAAPWTPGHYDAMSSWGHERPSTPLFPGILAPVAGVTG